MNRHIIYHVYNIPKIQMIRDMERGSRICYWNLTLVFSMTPLVVDVTTILKTSLPLIFILSLSCLHMEERRMTMGPIAMSFPHLKIMIFYFLKF